MADDEQRITIAFTGVDAFRAAWQHGEPDPVFRCCGGYGEHFEWCADQRRVERAELHAVLVARGLVADNPVVAAAYDVLAGAYLDERDRDDRARDDRARDAADDYRLAVGE